jgi:hypothetical protein
MDKAEIRSEIKKAKSLSDDEAIDVLWGALIKMADSMDGKDEQERVSMFLDAIQEEDIRPILNLGAIATLIYLDPPLETILAGPDEGPGPGGIEKAIGMVRSSRGSDPRAALRSLGEVLASIRNKKAEGFQTPSGPRDSEILSSARALLAALRESAPKIIK